MTSLTLEGITFNDQGLVPVIAQDVTTGKVLMQAWANRAALKRTLETDRMHYFSRSRNALWMKGETSGHTQEVVDMALDCDGDTVLATVQQNGPACHRGTDTCFVHADDRTPLPTLARLSATLGERRSRPKEGSYTNQLYDDPSLAKEKILEEAGELIQALEAESDDRVAEEAADLVYHALAACMGRGVTIERVMHVLEARSR